MSTRTVFFIHETYKFFLCGETDCSFAFAVLMIATSDSRTFMRTSFQFYHLVRTSAGQDKSTQRRW